MFTATFASFSNARQIFEDEHIACFHGSQNRVCDAVVHIGLKPLPTTRRLLKMPFRAFCAFSLKFGTKFLMLAHTSMQRSGGEKTGFGSYGDPANSEIATYDIAVGLNFWGIR